MNPETPIQPNATPPNIEEMLWKNLTSWVIATVVLVALIAGVIIAPILLTAYQVSKEPKNTVLWGWMYMWTEFRDPYTFHPLVCDNSQASQMTDQYMAILSDTPFEFKNVEAEPITDNHVHAKAAVECAFQEGAEPYLHGWEADFFTKISPPVGLCITEIRVTVGQDLCQIQPLNPETVEDETPTPDAN